MLVAVGLLMTSMAVSQANTSPTFTKDVLPILQKNCQICHRPGQIAPMSLLSYKETRPWAKAIRNAVVTRKMPPWFAEPRYAHFRNDRTLAQGDIDTIVKWVESGAPATSNSSGNSERQFPYSCKIRLHRLSQFSLFVREATPPIFSRIAVASWMAPSRDARSSASMSVLRF